MADSSARRPATTSRPGIGVPGAVARAQVINPVGSDEAGQAARQTGQHGEGRRTYSYFQHLITFFENLLLKKGILIIMGIGMSDLSQIGRPGANEERAVRVRPGHIPLEFGALKTQKG